MMVRKANGSLIKQDAALPDLKVANPIPDIDNLQRNNLLLIQRTQSALQRLTNQTNWQPDKNFTEQLKTIHSMLRDVKADQRADLNADNFAKLTDEQIAEMIKNIQSTGDQKGGNK